MEIKRNNKIVITGSMICKIIGFISLICGAAILIKGIVSGTYDYPSIAMTFGASVILLGLYRKRSS